MKHKHKRRTFHLRRVGLLGVLLAAFFIVRFDAGSLPRPLARASVLAYATEMSHGGLLAGTNAARAANGLGSLSLHGQLNNAAQMKAQHMADNNYWAHVAPDGTQPWYFFTQAGYSYIRAGENLAYGFSTSQGAVDGWMNSPSHKANILGNYHDVGFGIVNAPNYQSSGPQTIVVAHYGSTASSGAPAAPPPAPAAPASPAPPAPAAPTPVAEAKPTPVVEQPEDPPAETPAAEAEPTTKPESATQPEQPTEPTAPVQTGQATQVSVLSLMANKNLPFAALVSMVMVSFAVVGYALTHRAAFHHAVTTGEHFVMRHPGVDTGIIAALSALILLTTYGNIS